MLIEFVSIYALAVQRSVCHVLKVQWKKNRYCAGRGISFWL